MSLKFSKKANKTVDAYILKDFDESLGVNDRVALAQAEKNYAPENQHTAYD